MPFASRAGLAIGGTALRLGLVVLVAVMAGCRDSGSEKKEAEKAEAKPIVKTADRGAIKLTVTASADHISIAERLALNIDVVAEKGIDVEMPDFGAELKDFQVRDFHESPPKDVDDSHVRYSQNYDLDIYLSGQYAIPPVTVRYRDHRNQKADDHNQRADDAKPADEVAEGELTTEGFNVEVTSLLEGQFDPNKFRDVKPVATLPRDKTWFWAEVAGGVVVGLCGLVIMTVLLVRRRRAAPMIVIPPHEWALQQLRALADAKLIEAGKIKEFYYRLNEITRRYVELRFHLMAPERTTEEFLLELRKDTSFPAAHRPMLEEFLAACDLVKYTLYQPTTEEIEQVFSAARGFVTAAHDEPKVLQEVAA